MSSLSKLHSDLFNAFIGKVIAHRGCFDNKRIPENSLPSFEEAIIRGLPIELDVRLSRDGVPVVFHDPTPLRMCGVRSKISTLTLAEIKKFRLLKTNCKIPTLLEALRVIDGKVPVLIELKSSGNGTELPRAVQDILREYNGISALQSFSLSYLRCLARRLPKIPAGIILPKSLFHIPRKFTESQIPSTIILSIILLIAKPDFISCSFSVFPSDYIAKLRKSGVPVFSWTSRNLQDYKTAIAHSDAVIAESIDKFYFSDGK